MGAHMGLLGMGSLSRKLGLLMMLAISPALVILLYSGLEQRRQSIEYAQKNVFQLTHTMASTQQEVTRSVKQILCTLSHLPSIQAMDTERVNEIFKAIVAQNKNYNNIAISVINGVVLASGRSFNKVNLADRKHFIDALKTKEFVVGEYIVSRVGATVPGLAFAYPVLDGQGNAKAILTVVIKLSDFSNFHEVMDLPEKSFIAITDHNGVRLFYYPSQSDTNPVGNRINAKNWQIAYDAKEPGIFTSAGSDGINRIFAFEQVRLNRHDSPYLYVWAGIPEEHILGPANDALIRNLLLLLVVTVIALIVSWVIGRSTDALIGKLEQALKEIKTLQGILPICSFCKNIRNDDGYYEQIENYIHKHSGVDFSHTVCPTCMKKHYPDHFQEDDSDTEK